MCVKSKMPVTTAAIKVDFMWLKDNQPSTEAGNALLAEGQGSRPTRNQRAGYDLSEEVHLR